MAMKVCLSIGPKVYYVDKLTSTVSTCSQMYFIEGIINEPT